MDPFIDTNVYLFRWPFRRVRGDELPDLVERLRRHGVTEAWAGSFEALMHRDVEGVNERLVQACRQVERPRLVPFGTVNPTLPDWEEDLRRCAETFRMPGIRLHPAYHGYTLSSPAFESLLAQCERRGLLVQLAVTMEDDRTQHPVFRVPLLDLKPLPDLLRKTPNLRLELLNAQTTLRGEPLYRLVGAGQVYLDIATQEAVNGVATLAENVPLGRIVFGSYFPFFLFESALLKLQESPLPGRLDRDIRAGNARRLLPVP